MMATFLCKYRSILVIKQESLPTHFGNRREVLVKFSFASQMEYRLLEQLCSCCCKQVEFKKLCSVVAIKFKLFSCAQLLTIEILVWACTCCILCGHVVIITKLVSASRYHNDVCGLRWFNDMCYNQCPKVVSCPARGILPVRNGLVNEVIFPQPLPAYEVVNYYVYHFLYSNIS